MLLPNLTNAQGTWSQIVITYKCQRCLHTEIKVSCNLLDPQEMSTDSFRQSRHNALRELHRSSIYSTWEGVVTCHCLLAVQTVSSSMGIRMEH